MKKKLYLNEEIIRKLIKKIIKENITEGSSEGAVLFNANPKDASGIVNAIISGGASYGQNFEGILIQVLRDSLSKADVSDLNPAGQGGELDVTDEPGQVNKNAELADVIFGGSPKFDNAEAMSQATVLSAKSNKSALAFLGTVEINKLKKLANNVLASESLKLETSPGFSKFKVGTANFALNPIVSKNEKKVVYDLKIAYPTTPNIAIALPDDVTKEKMNEASQEFDSETFRKVILPLTFQKLATSSGESTGGLTKFVKLYNSEAKGDSNFSTTQPQTITDSSGVEQKINVVAPKGLTAQLQSDISKLNNIDSQGTLSTGDKDSLSSDAESSNSSTTDFIKSIVEEKIDKLADLYVENLKSKIQTLNSTINDHMSRRNSYVAKMTVLRIQAAANGSYAQPINSHVANEIKDELQNNGAYGKTKEGVNRNYRQATNRQTTLKNKASLTTDEEEELNNLNTQLEQSKTNSPFFQNKRSEFLRDNNIDQVQRIDLNSIKNDLNAALSGLKSDLLAISGDNIAITNETDLKNTVVEKIKEVYKFDNPDDYDGAFKNLASDNITIMKVLETSSGRFTDIERIVVRELDDENIEDSFESGINYGQLFERGRLYKIDNNGNLLTEIPDNDTVSGYYGFFNKYIQHVSNEEYYIQIELPFRLEQSNELKIKITDELRNHYNTLYGDSSKSEYYVEDTESRTAAVQNSLNSVFANKDVIDEYVVFKFLNIVLGPITQTVSALTQRPVEVYFNPAAGRPSPESFTGEDIQAIVTEISNRLNVLRGLIINPTDKDKEVINTIQTLATQSQIADSQYSDADVLILLQLLSELATERGLKSESKLNTYNSNIDNLEKLLKFINKLITLTKNDYPAFRIVMDSLYNKMVDSGLIKNKKPELTLLSNDYSSQTKTKVKDFNLAQTIDDEIQITPMASEGRKTKYSLLDLLEEQMVPMPALGAGSAQYDSRRVEDPFDIDPQTMSLLGLLDDDEVVDINATDVDTDLDGIPNRLDDEDDTLQGFGDVMERFLRNTHQKEDNYKKEKQERQFGLSHAALLKKKYYGRY